MGTNRHRLAIAIRPIGTNHPFRRAFAPAEILTLGCARVDESARGDALDGGTGMAEDAPVKRLTESDIAYSELVPGLELARSITSDASGLPESK